MSQSVAIDTFTDDDVTNFLGSIDLHQNFLKFQWSTYLDPTQSQATKTAAKQAVIDKLYTLQMTLNSIQKALAITPTSDLLDDTTIMQIGIMSEVEVSTDVTSNKTLSETAPTISQVKLTS